MSVEPEHLRIEANNLGFSALAWGEPGAPLALCLHGYPDTAWTWRHLGPHLAAHGWRVVAPFTRGYAPTELASDDDYSVAAQARDALALHSALGGDERAALIGHDWGALAAYNIAAHAPYRFRRVVTMAVPPPWLLAAALRGPGALPLLARQLRNSWYTMFNQLPGLAERAQGKLIPKLWRDWSPGFDADEDVRHVFAALDGRARRRAALRYYRCAADPRASRQLSQPGRQPVLFLHGQRDGCFSPALCRRVLPLLTGQSRGESIEGAGHFLQVERPAVVNDLITDWLEAAS